MSLNPQRIEKPHENPLTKEHARELLQARPDLLSKFLAVDDPSTFRILQDVTTNPALAQDFVKNNPLQASLAILRGTEKIHGQLHPPPPKNLVRRFFSTFISNADTEGAAQTAKGVFTLRKAFTGFFEPERAAAGPIPGAHERNQQRTELITNGATADGIAPAALRQLKYVTLAIADTPQHALKTQLKELLLPIPENNNRTYIPYTLDDPRLQETADTYGVLMHTINRWSKNVLQNKAVIDNMDSNTVRDLKAKADTTLFSGAIIIADRDGVPQPIFKLVDKQMSI